MRFWLREVAGWALVAVGLYLCLEVYNLVQEHLFFQTGPIVLMGIFIFRGGIQLLKLAVAARICFQAQELDEAPPRPVEKPRRPQAAAGK